MGGKMIFKKLSVPIAFILLANIVFDPKINFAITVLLLLWAIMTNKWTITKTFPEQTIYFILLFLGIGIGWYECAIGTNEWYTLFKQTYYFLMPFIYWHLGYMYQTKSLKRNKDCLFTVVVFSFFFALIDIISSLFTLIKLGGIASVYLYRETIGLSGGISFFGFMILLFFYKEIDLQKRYKNIIMATTLISLLMHFSRSSIVQILIFVLFMLPFSNMRTKFKMLTIGVILFFTIAILFPNLFESFMTKLLRSFTEIDFRQSNWNEWTINNNWRGYEAYCAIKQFNNSNLFTQLLGNGFGFKLDPGGYASLVTDEDGLIFLHNGYFTNLMYWGIVGFLMYIVWCISGYRISNLYHSKNGCYFSKAMFVMFIVCTYFVNGPLFSLSLSPYFFVLGIVKCQDNHLI